MARDRASPPEAKPWRLFVAFGIPPEALDAVERAVEPWRAAFPETRWVPRENRHVTLKFLGPTSPRVAPWVLERVGAVASARGPVATHLTRIGSFPSARRARVVWAGIDDADGALAGIAWALDEALGAAFPPEGRPYAPHLTVARSDPPLRLDGSVPTAALDPVSFVVERIDLYRSHLQRPSPRYESLATFRLEG